MRKKSHISLAGYLVREFEHEELSKHRKAFYLGSILPDLTPKMVTSPHEFDTSYGGLQQGIRALVADAGEALCTERVLWRRLGVVMHYLADYFTFPHNVTFGGNLKDHCLYERDMKYQMREYVRSQEAARIFRSQQGREKRITDIHSLFSYIEDTHRAYLKRIHTVADDCRMILELCSRVLISIVQIIQTERVMQTAGVLRCA